jgi:hypothetical protein
MFVPRARAAVENAEATTTSASDMVSTTDIVADAATIADTQPDTAIRDDLSLCVTLGVPCHTIEVSAFTLSPELADKNLEHVDLNFSFASAAPEGDGADDKLVVRYFLNGQWRHGGEIFLNKEMSNAANGGYFSAALNDVQNWTDVSNMRVVIEYVRADGRQFAEFYLDSVWLDVSYKDRFADPDRGLGEEATLPENVETELASRDADVARSLLVGDGSYILFPYIDDIDEETVAIRADKALYTAQGDTERNEVFVSVTNTSRESDLFTLSAAFPGSGGRMESLQQFMSNVHCSRAPVSTQRYPPSS